MRRFIRLPVRVGLLIVIGLSLPAAWLQALAAQGGEEPLSADGPRVVIRAEYIEGGSTARLLPAPASLSNPGDQRSLAEAPQASFNVIYDPDTPWPSEAQHALEYALNLWAREISSPVPIVIKASWEPLGWGVLGAAGTFMVTNFPGQPIPNFGYPSALANKLAGTDLYRNMPDIQMTFSSTFSWYYGTDGKVTDPTRQYDLVTVILHELGHGLGFLGSMNMSGGYGLIDGSFPFIYDRYVKNGQGTPILSFPNQSAELGVQLTSNNLFFTGPRLTSLTGLDGAELYAPYPWREGSSYSHLDEGVYARGNANSLMTPLVANGEVVHVPGPYSLAILEDLGWTVSQDWTQIPTPTARPTVLPVLPATPTPTRVPGSPPVYLPLVHSVHPQLAASVSGTLALNGIGAAGVQVELCRLSGTSCPRVATAVTGANGAYTFPNVPLPASGLTHYVRYWNLAGTPGRIFYWAEPLLVKAGQNNTARTIDIADVSLTLPAVDASASLPATFTWKMRPAPGAASDQYQIHLSGEGYDPWWWEALGHTGTYSLKSLPTAKSGKETFKYGAVYRWEVWVCAPQGGCGLSLESRKVTLQAGLAPQPDRGEELFGPEQVLTAEQQTAQDLYYLDEPMVRSQ